MKKGRLVVDFQGNLNCITFWFFVCWVFALLQFVPLVGPSLTQEVAPSAALEFDPWPAFGDRFAQRMEKELPSLWSPGRIETQDQWDVETFLLWEAIALEYRERI